MDASSSSASTTSVYASLDELFRKTKTFSKENATHSIRMPTDGKLDIQFKDRQAFWELYCNAVNRGESLAVMEYVKLKEIPLIVDIDFTYEGDEVKRYYSQKDLKNIIHIYKDVIRETLVVENERELMCCVMEKENPGIKNGHPYDGIHMIFPDCVTDIDIQRDVIRPRVLERIRETHIFNKMNLKGFEEGEVIKDDVWDSIFDKNIPRNGMTWVMYGSKKDSSSTQQYKLSMIVDHKLETRAIDEVLARDDFGMWHEVLDEEFFEKHPIQYYLPMWLSIQGRQGFMKRKAQTQQQMDGLLIRKVVSRQKQLARMQNMEPVDLTQQLQDVESLLGFLSTKHRDDYETWVRTGMVIYSICKGGETGLLLWRNWSKTSSKYVDGECEKKWTSFDDNHPSSLGTLCYWAKTQNPIKYKNWRETKINYYINQAESGSHYDLAVLLKKLYSEKYICASISQNMWFEFREHRWYPIEKGYKLADAISTDLVKLVNKRRQGYVTQTDGTDDAAEKKMKDLSRLIHNLKQAPFKRSVLEECRSLFYNENFFDLLDENKHLMCFKNGVLDMTTTPWIFRDGTPDDYLKRCAGICFPTWLTKDSPEVLKTHQMLEKMFVNPRIRKFAVQTFASIFKGGNFLKTFPIMTGGTDGGKSNIQSLVMKILGCKNGYATTLNTSIATGKRTQSSAATADIESLKGIRAVFLQEPSPGEEFNIGVVKQFTGNDVLYSRGMYKAEPTIIVPQFKFFLSTNVLPSTKNSQDQAFFNRTRVIRCESRFIKPTDFRKSQVPDSEEEQFKQKLFFADMKMEEQYDDVYAPGLCWILANELDSILTKGIFTPSEVLEATESYQQANDVFRQFYTENFERTDNEEDEITLSSAFMMFKTWYNEAFPGAASRMPSRNDLQKNMEGVYGVMQKNKWTSLKLMDKDD